MKWPRFDNRLVIPFQLAAMISTVLLTPWWGTMVVAGVLRILFFTSVRILSSISFLAWVAACAYRDFENAHGPTRVFAKLFSLSRLGFEADSEPSRAIVFGAMGFVGLALGLAGCGTVAAFGASFSTPILRRSETQKS